MLAALCGLALLSVGVAYGQQSSFGGTTLIPAAGVKAALADCQAPRYDVSCDGKTDSLDLLIVAQHFGEQWTPSPTVTDTLTETSTATITATPSQTNTSTPTPTSVITATSTPPGSTPTATPTSTVVASNSVAQILRDSDEVTQHDGNICIPDSYSWSHTSDVQGASAAGYPLGTAWGVVNACGANVAGVVVFVQDFQGWVLTPDVSGNLGWREITSPISWCETMDYNTEVFQGPGCNLSGTWPAYQQTIHWASNHNAVGQAVCALSMYQVKYTGPVGVRVYASAGFDWWSGGSIRAGGVGRYGLIPKDVYGWRDFSTCSPAQLAAHPPPL